MDQFGRGRRADRNVEPFWLVSPRDRRHNVDLYELESGMAVFVLCRRRPLWRLPFQIQLSLPNVLSCCASLSLTLFGILVRHGFFWHASVWFLFFVSLSSFHTCTSLHSGRGVCLRLVAMFHSLSGIPSSGVVSVQATQLLCHSLRVAQPSLSCPSCATDREPTEFLFTDHSCLSREHKGHRDKDSQCHNPGVEGKLRSAFPSAIDVSLSSTIIEFSLT